MTKFSTISSILNVKPCENLNLDSDFNSPQTKTIAECLYSQENNNEEKTNEKTPKESEQKE